MCAFTGAAVPLLIAGAIPGPGWPAIAVAVACLGLLGAGIGLATSSCKICWAGALVVAGGLLAWLGELLRVVVYAGTSARRRSLRPRR
ncbi:MAG: hypothetical protein MZW92_37190 [Comamonadaceae bacterium]|nr:hypothetical protein [Comamonadaceae bacterium]